MRVLFGGWNLYFSVVWDFGHAKTCSCLTSDRRMKNPCSGFKTEKFLVSKVLKKGVSWWSYITLIRWHWTLCVGAGKKNVLLNLHCINLCLWVSWITARQNNSGCWVSPEDKNSYSAAWDRSGRKALPLSTTQSNDTISLILVPFQ